MAIILSKRNKVRAHMIMISLSVYKYRIKMVIVLRGSGTNIAKDEALGDAPYNGFKSKVCNSQVSETRTLILY